MLNTGGEKEEKNMSKEGTILEQIKRGEE